MTKVKDGLWRKYIKVKVDMNIIYNILSQMPEDYKASEKYEPLQEVMKIKLDKRYKPNYTMNNYNHFTRKGKIIVPHVYLHMRDGSDPKDFTIEFTEITPYSMVLLQNIKYVCNF